MSSFKSNENIRKKEDGSYYVVSANKSLISDPVIVLLYGSLIGILSVNLTLFLTISAFPRSVGPLENI